jgi:hypothetical protein
MAPSVTSYDDKFVQKRRESIKNDLGTLEKIFFSKNQGKPGNDFYKITYF